MATYEELQKQKTEIEEKMREAYKKEQAEGEEHFKEAFPILEPYLYFYDWEKKEDLDPKDYNVRGVPAEIMQKLIDQNLMEADMHAANSKFTMADLIKLGKEYNGFGEGRARPNDIYFDGMVFNISEEEAKKLKKKLHPDEFDKQGKGWRFWWD